MSKRKSKPSRQARSVLNNRTLFFLAVLLLVTPLMLGGNRPAVWALDATVVFGWMVLYVWRVMRYDITPRVLPSQFPLIAGLFFAFAAYCLVQVMPVFSFLSNNILAFPSGYGGGDTISVAPGDTFLALLRWLTYGSVFYLVLQIAANPGRSAFFTRVLFAIIVAHAVYGLLLRFQFGDKILFVHKWAYTGSVTGGFVNRNSFATFLAFGVPLGAALIGTRVSKYRRDGGRKLIDLLTARDGVILYVVGLLLVVMALVATESRMGNIAAFLGGIVTCAIMAANFRSAVTTRSIVGLLAVLLAAFGLVVAFYGSSLVDRFSYDTASISVAVRAALYEQTWRMFMDRPLLGFGGNGFEFAFPLFHQDALSADYLWDLAHSTYLALWSEYGLIFGSMPLVIVALVFWRILRSDFSLAEDPSGSIAAIGVIVTAAVHSTVDFSLEMEGVTLLFVAILANGIGETRLPRERDATAEAKES
ncbi:O-antigen ligase family protein [Martelella alba]|uniref:O-antigen ligase family protein n=1 Tax=Martelella alba TaxID=2590451 RepID=A0A506UDL4_9HYPH|nr:O-antigen ligase family protein [Martelella alba]TPW30905.1 O-antigen ligase family protein [Martelella alba]